MNVSYNKKIIITNKFSFIVSLVRDVKCLVSTESASEYIFRIIFIIYQIYFEFYSFWNIFIYSYNPFIYCWLNKTFRNGAKKYLFCLFCCWHQNESMNSGNIANTVPTDPNRNTIELQVIQHTSNFKKN
jgi:hypothetical protein